MPTIRHGPPAHPADDAGGERNASKGHSTRGASFRRLARAFDSDAGIAITEYGILIALMALAMIAVLAIFGGAISSWFASRTGNITTF